CLEAPCPTLGARQVASPERCVEAIARIVSQTYCFLDVLRSNDGHDGSESLFGHDLHSVVALVYDRGLEMEAMSRVPPSGQNLCTFGYRIGEVILDNRHLSIIAHRPKGRQAIRTRRRYLELACRFHQRSNETIADGFYDVHALDRTAVLTRIVKRPVENPR